MKPEIGKTIVYTAKVFEKVRQWKPGEHEAKLEENARKLVELDFEKAIAEDGPREEMAAIKAAAAEEKAPAQEVLAKKQKTREEEDAAREAMQAIDIQACGQIAVLEGQVEAEVTAIDERLIEETRAEILARALEDKGSLKARPGMIMDVTPLEGKEGSEDERDYVVSLRVFGVGDFVGTPFSAEPMTACHWTWPPTS